MFNTAVLVLLIAEFHIKRKDKIWTLHLSFTFEYVLFAGNPIWNVLFELSLALNDRYWWLFLQLTSLLAEIGLNIQEAHAFSTVDGYSLDVFVVDGWPFEVCSYFFHTNNWIKCLSRLENNDSLINLLGNWRAQRCIGGGNFKV